MRTPLLPTPKAFGSWTPTRTLRDVRAGSVRNQARGAAVKGIQQAAGGRSCLPQDSGKDVINLCNFRGPIGMKMNLCGDNHGKIHSIIGSHWWMVKWMRMSRAQPPQNRPSFRAQWRFPHVAMLLWGCFVGLLFCCSQP